MQYLNLYMNYYKKTILTNYAKGGELQMKVIKRVKTLHKKKLEHKDKVKLYNYECSGQNSGNCSNCTNCVSGCS